MHFVVDQHDIELKSILHAKLSYIEMSEFAKIVGGRWPTFLINIVRILCVI